MRTVFTFILITLMSHSSFATEVEGSDKSLYQTIIDIFDTPTGAISVLNYEDMKGIYVGRCYPYDRPDTSYSGLMMIAKKKVSDNGPLFPPSYEEKAIEFIGTEQTHYDDLSYIHAELKMILDANWEGVSEINKLGDSWEYFNFQVGQRTYIKSTSQGVMTVSYVEDSSQFTQEEKEKITHEAYKRIVRACYYFRKVENSEIVLNEN